MLFVPLPLFVTFVLIIVLLRRLVAVEEPLTVKIGFSALIGLFATQSSLIALRWGYGFEAAGTLMALIAPLLPMSAYLAYRSLMHVISRADWIHAVPFVLVAILVAIRSELVDVVIIAIYLGYGLALLWHAKKGSNELALARIGSANDAWRALVITGVALILSACVDLFVIGDFIWNGGRNVPLVLSFAPATFVLVIALASASARDTLPENHSEDEKDLVENAQTKTPDESDLIIAGRVRDLFEQSALHTDMNLNLRRIARRLQLPDRQVSNAINRTTGLTISRFVNQYRVKEAQKLMSETDMSILKISLASGFMSKSNFNREFARICGQSPSQWRESNQKIPPA